MINRSNYRKIYEAAEQTPATLGAYARRVGKKIESLDLPYGELVPFIVDAYGLANNRGVYFNDKIAIKFCATSGPKFTNTVASLSTLSKYDNIPFLVVKCSPEGNQVFLANSTFVEKLSRPGNTDPATLRGSFNGGDIDKHPFWANAPKNFVDLFQTHIATSHRKNMERIAQATGGRAPRQLRYNLTEQGAQTIMRGIAVAANFVNGSAYEELKADLDSRVASIPKSIMKLVFSQYKHSVRGKIIEQLIVLDKKSPEYKELIKGIKEGNIKVFSKNSLGDYIRSVGDYQCFVDIKTRSAGTESNPKAFNIDKYLKTMAETKKGIFLFYFVGLNERGVYATGLYPLYSEVLMSKLFIQDAWSSAGARGDIQLKGRIVDEVLSEIPPANVRPKVAKKFVEIILEQ